MKWFTSFFYIFFLLTTTVLAAEKTPASSLFANEFFSLKLKDIDGKSVDLNSYRGKVLMIVNTASQCGFTPQFKKMAELQAKLGPAGLQILAFPSDDFHQDTGNNLEIKKFANENYKINFPLFEKGSVTGSKKQELYRTLVSQRSDFLNEVQWNFEKFVLNRKGLVVDRFRSTTSPDDPKVMELLQKLLAEK